MLESLKKNFHMDLEITACMILGHNQDKITWTKSRFSGNYLRIVPNHAAKFEKILKADPDILACIILGHNCVRIAYLAQKWIFFFFNFT